jgi:hypothetical protein
MNTSSFLEVSKLLKYSINFMQSSLKVRVVASVGLPAGTGFFILVIFWKILGLNKRKHLD